MSAADLLAVLVSRHLRYDWDNPRTHDNDHLIFSKGQGFPLAVLDLQGGRGGAGRGADVGVPALRFHLEGHPTPVLPWVDVATGSLGQGLPDGVGVALAGSASTGPHYRVWVLCGDSEMAEGPSGRLSTRPRSTSSPT